MGQAVRIEKVTPAAERAVTLSDAKTHCRIDWDSEDVYLAGLIDTAAAFVETTIGRSLVSTEWRMSMECWPTSDGVDIPFPPLIDVAHVKYLDVDGVLQTLSAESWYVLRDSFVPSRLHIEDDVTLPDLLGRSDSVQITWTAGYGATSSSVPPAARHAILMLVGHWWENREAVLTGTISKEIDVGVASLLRPLKTGFVAGA